MNPNQKDFNYGFSIQVLKHTLNEAIKFFFYQSIHLSRYLMSTFRVCTKVTAGRKTFITELHEIQFGETIVHFISFVVDSSRMYSLVFIWRRELLATPNFGRLSFHSTNVFALREEKSFVLFINMWQKRGDVGNFWLNFSAFIL